MDKEHRYTLLLRWTGNTGAGTAGYKSYSRDHEVSAASKAVVAMSSDPAFMGNPANYNPEELLVASLSSCHMLWYLHLCAVNGVIVTSYTDDPEGKMTENPNGSGKFTQVTLRPSVVVATVQMVERAYELHKEAHECCFIANSCNFLVTHMPVIEVAEAVA